MELKYLRVSPEEGVEEAIPRPVSSPTSRRSDSVPRQILRILHQYTQITSGAYQHGMPERKMSFGIFMIFFVCFIFSAFYFFTLGDVCSSYQEGLVRLRLDRDRLQAEVDRLTKELRSMGAVVGDQVMPPPPVSGVIP